MVIRIKQVKINDHHDENNRASKLLMTAIGVLEKRLGNPNKEGIRNLYLKDPDTSGLFPDYVKVVVRRYVSGRLNAAEAREELRNYASGNYNKTSCGMGIKS